MDDEEILSPSDISSEKEEKKNDEEDEEDEEGVEKEGPYIDRDSEDDSDQRD